MSPSLTRSDFTGMLIYGFEAEKGANVIIPCVGMAIMQFGLTLSYIGTIVYSASVFPNRGGDTFGSESRSAPSLSSSTSS